MLSSALLVAFITLLGPAAQSEVAFRIPDPDLIPEGIAYDPTSKTFFVGSTFKRKIVAIAPSGQVTDFTAEAQDGLFGVLGLRVDATRRRLWAISSNAGGTMPSRALDKICLGCSTVTVYDVDSKKLLKKYELSNKPDVHFLNDLAIARNGDVFVTDTISGNLYRIAADGDALTPFANFGKQAYPNGIDVADDGRTLYVATAVGLRRVDSATAAVTSIGGMGDKVPSIDGLAWFRGSLVAIQPFESERKVVQYVLSGDTIAKSVTIVAEHPSFKQPTTGVIVGSDFYFIANAQLQVFRAMYKEGAYDRTALADVLVMKTPLPAVSSR